MSSDSTSRRARRRRNGLPSLPDVILKGEPLGELGEPRIVIAELEAKLARAKVKESASSKRSWANELHRQADQLYHRGDYESALVLYQRAAQLYPREAVHAVAARRTEAAIRSAAQPPRELARLLRASRSPAQMPALVCPEAAASRARAIVAEAPDPVSEIPRILGFFDARKEFWRLSSPALASGRRPRSKTMLRQLSKCVKATAKELECAYEAGDPAAVRKLSEELVSLVSLSDESARKQVDTYGYLAIRQLALGRHDRALELAAKMLFLARTSGDGLAMVSALATLGKVHSSFGHLDALVRVWERLAEEIRTEELAQAWLYHDIGRCHLELGNLSRGLEAAQLCLGRASRAGSAKWTLRGQLLRGQLLLKFGRFVEAVSALKSAARLAEPEPGQARPSPMLAYVQSLVDQVARLLRRLNEERERRVESQRAEAPAGPAAFNSISKTNGDAGARPGFQATAAVLLDAAKQQRTCSDEEAVVEEKEEKEMNEVAQLLARTRALRGSQSASMRDKLQVLAAPRALSLSASDMESTKWEEEEDEEEERRLGTSRTRTIRRASRCSDDEALQADRERSCSSSLADSTRTESALHLDDLAKFNEEEVDSATDTGSCTSADAKETNDYAEPLLFSPDVYHQQEEEEVEKQLTSLRSASSTLVRKSAVSVERENEANWPGNGTIPESTSQQKHSIMTEYLRSLESSGTFEEVLSQ